MKKAIIIIVVILILFTFYPGLKKDNALNTLNSTDWIAKQHIDGKVYESDLRIVPLPFGGLVSTYDGMWYVTFWGTTIP